MSYRKFNDLKTWYRNDGATDDRDGSNVGNDGGERWSALWWAHAEAAAMLIISVKVLDKSDHAYSYMQGCRESGNVNGNLMKIKCFNIDYNNNKWDPWRALCNRRRQQTNHHVFLKVRLKQYHLVYRVTQTKWGPEKASLFWDATVKL